MKQKLYILHYPSPFGMGSDVDDHIVNDEDLRYIIRKEVEKKRNENNYSQPLTGSCEWLGKKFCDSSDMAEIEEDVIHKCLTRCSTYANDYDLTPLPGDIPLTVRTDTVNDGIFHIWNEFMTCYTDVIAGETAFTRYFLDLTGYDGFAGLEAGKIHEFVSFEMKCALENSYFMNEIDEILEINKDRYLRFESKLNGTYKNSGKIYYDDLTVDKDDKEYYGKWCRIYKKEWEDAVRKFAEPITCENDYLKHIYMHQHNKYLTKQLKTDMKELKKTDFRKLAYQYPVYMSDIGTICSGKTDDTQYFRYDELFGTGLDFKYLPARDIDIYNSMEEIGEVGALRALINVFGLS